MYRSLLLLSISLVVTVPAQAAEKNHNNDDVIIVTGLRPLAPEDVTATVTVLGEEDLAIRDAAYIADQLRAVPGVAVSRTGARNGLTQVRVRGAEANHTLVLLNGIEVSDPVTGETDFGLWSGLNAARVEILRGEQSALYGSDAIGGVVNIITDSRPGLSGLLEAGSQESYRLNTNGGFATKKGSLSLAVAAFETAGVDTSGTGGDRDGSEASSATFTGNFDLNETWSMNGLLRFSRDKVARDDDTDFDGLLNDTDDVTNSNQVTIGGTLEGIANGFDHLLRFSHSKVTRENKTNGAFVDETKGERIKANYSPSKEFQSAAVDTVLTGLIEYEKEDYERISVDTLFGDPNQQQSFETLALAAETRVSYGKLTLQGSVRYDDNDGRFDNTTTWRLGTSYTLTDKTRLRASTGTGVKNPTFTELFGFFPGSFTGNPDLKPEQSTSYEVGIDHSAGPVDISATWFNAALEDEIFTVFNPDFTSSPANRSGESDRQGFELAVRWQATETVSIAASFSDISSDNDQNEPEIRIPDQTGSVALNWQSARRDRLRAGLAVDYVGEQEDFFFTFPVERVTLDSYALVSASAHIPVTSRIALTLRGRNILDQEIEDVFGFQQPGAGFFVGFHLE